MWLCYRSRQKSEGYSHTCTTPLILISCLGVDYNSYQMWSSNTSWTKQKYIFISLSKILKLMNWILKRWDKLLNKYQLKTKCHEGKHLNCTVYYVNDMSCSIHVRNEVNSIVLYWTRNIQNCQSTKWLTEEALF